MIGRPAATLTLGASAVRGLDLAEAAVRRLRVDLSVGEGHDRVQLWLWPRSTIAEAEPGALLTVALGTGAGDPEDVLRAEVSGVDVGPAHSVLTALAPSRRLAGIQVGRAWQQTTLGQVVRDLLDDGGVDAGEVSAPLALPALHVDPHRSIWSALHDLARRTGHQITTSPDGAVSFGPVPGTGGGTGPGDGELRAGADLLSTSAGRRPSRPALARTSPAGPKYWYQLEASPDDGSAVLVLDPALRTREAADAATEAAAGRASRATTTARLRVPGRPALRAGGIVRADGQAYRVLEVCHLVEPSRGYVCDLVLEGDA